MRLISDHLSRRIRNQTICICENAGADQLRGDREAEQRLCFRYRDSTIPLLYFLTLKFAACSHLLWSYSLVCVRPGRKPKLFVFMLSDCLEGFFSSSIEFTSIIWLEQMRTALTPAAETVPTNDVYMIKIEPRR